jgi:hypothetical protein
MVLKCSLTMKWEKLVLKTFLDYFCLWLYCACIKWVYDFSILLFCMNFFQSPFFYAFYASSLSLKELYFYNQFLEGFNRFWFFLSNNYSPSIHLQVVWFGNKSTRHEEGYIPCNLKSFIHGNENLKKFQILLSFIIGLEVPWSYL